MISKEIRKLIRRIFKANPGWGSPRIVSELSCYEFSGGTTEGLSARCFVQ